MYILELIIYLLSFVLLPPGVDCPPVKYELNWLIIIQICGCSSKQLETTIRLHLFYGLIIANACDWPVQHVLTDKTPI